VSCPPQKTPFVGFQRNVTLLHPDRPLARRQFFVHGELPHLGQFGNSPWTGGFLVVWRT